MNIPLLKRIQRQIDKSPDLFLMDCTGQKRECGTAYCIAGWACVLSGVPLSFEEDPDGVRSFEGMEKAEDLLQISNLQGDNLFLEDQWPVEFQRDDGVREPLPALAIKRIDHFIATEGRE